MDRTYIIMECAEPYKPRGRAKLVNCPNFDGDWSRRYFPDHKPTTDIDAYRIDGVAECGDGSRLFFTEELANCDGCWFGIFAEPTTTREQVQAAKADIRSKRDVVSFTTYRVTEWLD